MTSSLPSRSFPVTAPSRFRTAPSRLRTALACFGTALACFGSVACGSSSANSNANGNPNGSGGGSGVGGAGGGGAVVVEGRLAEKYAEHFPIGAAVSAWHLENTTSILEEHFNHLTAENAMKTGLVHPTEDGFNWDEADAIADFARERGMTMTGHTLLWHRQQPGWMFEGLTAEDPESIEILKGRLQSHIAAMVERYADVVTNWDVVNEAISDDSSKTYRDEGSEWYRIFGSEEYIYWAFFYAKEALEAHEPGSSAGKLYYNDYNVTLKVDQILEMLAWLENDKGLKIDGVGDQGHYRIDWPPVSEIRATYDKLTAAGYKLKVSELDVSLYNDYPSGSFEPAPELEFTAALESQQAERYGALFELFREYSGDLTSVTLWGVTDDRTWLDNEPVEGRNDHPLLWNDAKEPKAALEAILDF